MRKFKIVIINSSILKIIKLIKIILTRIITKKTIMWGNTVVIHIVLKKKTTKLNSQPVQYKKNKIDKDNFRKNS